MFCWLCELFLKAPRPSHPLHSANQLLSSTSPNIWGWSVHRGGGKHNTSALPAVVCTARISHLALFNVLSLLPLVEKGWWHFWRSPCPQWPTDPSVYQTASPTVGWSLCQTSTIEMMGSNFGISSTGENWAWNVTFSSKWPDLMNVFFYLVVIFLSICFVDFVFHVAHKVASEGFVFSVSRFVTTPQWKSIKMLPRIWESQMMLGRRTDLTLHVKQPQFWKIAFCNSKLWRAFLKVPFSELLQHQCNHILRLFPVCIETASKWGFHYCFTILSLFFLHIPHITDLTQLFDLHLSKVCAGSARILLQAGLGGAAGFRAAEVDSGHLWARVPLSKGHRWA